jgi:hypothetical protein
MSVYMFGKLFASPAQIADAKRRMFSLVEDADAGISFDPLDEDDRQAIDELAGRAPGVAFSVSSRAMAESVSRWKCQSADWLRCLFDRRTMNQTFHRGKLSWGTRLA